MRMFELAFIGIVLLSAKPVAACPPRQAVFLFDQSDSMGDPGSTGTPKWQIARTKAINDFLTLPPGTIVAIAGFENATTGATPYYTDVVTFANNKIKGTDDAFLLGKISDTAADLGNQTPLAGAACKALNQVWLFIPGGDATCSIITTRSLYLYSDGLENSTPATPTPPTDPNCSGINSTTPFDATKLTTDFGLTVGSWQRKVANMAYYGNPNPPTPRPVLPVVLRPVMNVSVLFDFVGGSLSGMPSGPDRISDSHLNGELQPSLNSLDANGLAFLKGLTTVTLGSYFEAKQVNGGAATKLPMPGDTNPTPTQSCVDQVDLDRIVVVFGQSVTNTDLQQRDVNHDRVIDINDYALATQNFGKCS